MLEPIDVVQQERGPAARRQLPKCALEIDSIDRAIRQPMSGCVRECRRVVQPVGDLPGASRAAAHVVEDLIHPQTIQPRAERRIAAKAIELPVRRQKNLLQQVLGIRRVPQHPARQALEASRMGLVELFECAQFPPAAPFDELQVGLAG